MERRLPWQVSATARFAGGTTRGHGSTAIQRRTGTRGRAPAQRLKGAGPLNRAVSLGDVRRVRALIDAGTDPNGRDEAGWFPLLSAAVLGSTALVEALLDAGADLNAQAADGTTALMKATLWHHTAVVAVLLERGADVHMRDERGWTAAQLAAELGHHDLAAVLTRFADGRGEKR